MSVATFVTMTTASGNTAHVAESNTAQFEALGWTLAVAPEPEAAPEEPKPTRRRKAAQDD